MKKSTYLRTFWLLLFCLGMGNLTKVNAQVALGIRLGDPSGLNARFDLSRQNALDVNLGLRGPWAGRYSNYSYGYSGMVNYIWTKNTSARGLTWYYGIGGFFYSDYYRYDIRSERDGYYSSFGLDIPIGLDYKIADSPLHLFGELNPGFGFGYYGGPFVGGGLGIRFKFGE